MKTLSISLVAAVLGLAASSSATLIVDTNSGHAYEIIRGDFTWDAANLAAPTLSYSGYGTGHLATLTSDEEVQFLFDNLVGTAAFKNLHIGGYQATDSATKSSGWAWVTGEVWDFTNWVDGEPNDRGLAMELNQENYLQLDYEGRGSRVGWNDISATWVGGYLVEFSPNEQRMDLPAQTPVPEPSTYGLLAAGSLLGLVAYRRRLGKR